jgi:hypothetical protein
VDSGYGQGMGERASTAEGRVRQRKAMICCLASMTGRGLQ